MGDFDIANRIDREARRCKTHAFAARLFAGRPIHPANASIWEQVALGWDQLAAMKEQLALTQREVAAAEADLAARQARLGDGAGPSSP